MVIHKLVEGKHNKEGFRYNKGFLEMFGRRWDRADIKTLVETANLLDVQGYKLKEPVETIPQEVYGIWGEKHTVNKKIYDEQGESSDE